MIDELDSNIISLAFKLGKKLECKFPLKNNTSIPLAFECALLAKFEEDFPYEAQISTVSLSVQPQT